MLLIAITKIHLRLIPLTKPVSVFSKNLPTRYLPNCPTIIIFCITYSTNQSTLNSLYTTPITIDMTCSFIEYYITSSLGWLIFHRRFLHLSNPRRFYPIQEVTFILIYTPCDYQYSVHSQFPLFTFIFQSITDCFVSKSVI
jgi:hypothetical protein